MNRPGWRIFPFLALAVGLGAAGAPPPPAPYAAVDAAPVKTSIYIGTAYLTAGRFIRHNQTYVAEYAARVFPYFFLNENGRVLIDVPDESLRRLAAGTGFEFQGRAVRQDGKTRLVTGRVSPLSPSTGKLKVRVVVNRHLILIFNSTYVFPMK